VLIDACVRLLPGVMGNQATPDEESFEGGILEYPHYTRPALWRDGAGTEWAVPEVLISGHHEKVGAWRRAEAEQVTQARRPDLWAKRVRRGN
jgi:tRNA (guanine37-N1)-methyltransferase